MVMRLDMMSHRLGHGTAEGKLLAFRSRTIASCRI
jgi:hypothetical protein